MKISWIEDQAVAAGGIPIDLKDVKSLKEQGIQAIVTLTEAPLTHQKELPAEVLKELGVETLHVAVVDQHPPTLAQARSVNAFVERMNKAEKAVYVHCAAGVGRTGTMLHAMYMVGGLSLEEAKDLIKTHRPASQFFMLSPSQQAFLNKLSEMLV